jgi:hypothetical protein
MLIDAASSTAKTKFSGMGAKKKRTTNADVLAKLEQAPHLCHLVMKQNFIIIIIIIIIMVFYIIIILTSANVL